MAEERCSIAPLLALAAALLISGCTANGPQIFVFGDSNSDTGGLSAGLGLEFGYPYGRTFFNQTTGRACDGRLVIDFLCEYLGIEYLNPYLNSIEARFVNGANFAICGAATLPESDKFNLNVQMRQFSHFYRLSTQLQSKGAANWIGEDGFKNALYIIDIGQNDLSAWFGFSSYTKVIQQIPNFISQIRDALWAIYQHGGRKFWIHATGPLGCLPQELAIRLPNKNESKYDEHGCLKALNQGSKAFNAKLNALCQELQSQMEDSTIVYVDVYSIKLNLIANYSSYGIKNPLTACCGYGGFPYNIDLGTMCGDTGCSVCERATQHVSWDGTHYTEVANSIVASEILSTKYSSPPLQFNFFITTPDSTS